MSVWGKAAVFAGGALFGTLGLQILGSRDAKKVYTHATAAYLRCKDQVMRQVETVQDNCADIVADAKEINAKRAAEAEAEVIEDAADAGEA